MEQNALLLKKLVKEIAAIRAELAGLRKDLNK